MLALVGCTSSSATTSTLPQSFELRVSRVAEDARYRITIAADDLAEFPYEGALPTDESTLLTSLDHLEGRLEGGSVSVVLLAADDNPEEKEEGNFYLELMDVDEGRIGTSELIATKSAAESVTSDLTTILPRPVRRDLWVGICGFDILEGRGGYRLARLSDALAIDYATDPYTTPGSAKLNVEYVTRRAHDAENWATFEQLDGRVALGVLDVDGSALLLGTARYDRADHAVFALSRAPAAFDDVPRGCRAP